MKTFYAVLLNNLVSSVTTSYLWFSLTLWAYSTTQSVLTTGLLSGSYMLLTAGASLVFGAFVDSHHKKQVMLLANIVTATAFATAGVIYWLTLQGDSLRVNNPTLWIFGTIVLAGAVIGSMRSVAMSTMVTLLVPKERRAKANGSVGVVNGVSLLVASVVSGLSIGLLGMAWTLVISVTLMTLTTVHMSLLKVPESKLIHDPEFNDKKIDIRGSWVALLAVPGLLGLVTFSFFNNLIDGVLNALLSPYGLTLFAVEAWGIVIGTAGLSFVIGGLLVTKIGLGKKPLRVLMLTITLLAAITALLPIREIPWLLLVGISLYMMALPFAEAAEQTVLQKVVPYSKQGRVFGFALAIESIATPITAFVIAPIAEFWIIPTFRNPDIQTDWSWILGFGQMRGVAVIFLASGLLLIVLVILAVCSKSYKSLSRTYNAE